MDLRDGESKEKLSLAGRKAYETLREKVDFMEKDVVIYRNMEQAFKLLYHGDLVQYVEQEIGMLT